MVMSMGWDYVSELRSITSLLFIPRGDMSSYNHGGMMVWTEEVSWLVNQSSLSIIPAESYDNKQDELVKEWKSSLVKYFCSYTHVIFLHSVKSYDMESLALLPLPREMCCGVLLPLKSIASAGFEHANLGPNGKHAIHYATEVTYMLLRQTSPSKVKCVT
jgi:hypothetical protein